VDKIILYDNSPTETDLCNLFDYKSIIYHHSDINSISKAYNFAFQYAKANNYDYILTMDQDSYFYDFRKFIDDIKIHKIYGIIGCNVDNKNTCSNELFTQVSFMQNSGTIHKTDIVNLLEGWDETFTIDCIDHDYCYKAKHLNIPLYINNEVFLKHRIGEEKKVLIANTTIYITSYSPNRLYLMFKDYFIFFKKWRNEAAQLKTHFIKGWLKNSIKILLFDNVNKWDKLSAIIKGTIHGLKYKMPNNL